METPNLSDKEKLLYGLLVFVVLTALLAASLHQLVRNHEEDLKDITIGELCAAQVDQYPEVMQEAAWRDCVREMTTQ